MGMLLTPDLSAADRYRDKIMGLFFHFRKSAIENQQPLEDRSANRRCASFLRCPNMLPPLVTLSITKEGPSKPYDVSGHLSEMRARAVAAGLQLAQVFT
jgi:hypothetical protein